MTRKDAYVGQMGFVSAARTCPFGLINTLLSLLMYKENPAKNTSSRKKLRNKSASLKDRVDRRTLMLPMLKYGDCEMVI